MIAGGGECIVKELDATFQLRRWAHFCVVSAVEDIDEADEVADRHRDAAELGPQRLVVSQQVGVDAVDQTTFEKKVARMEGLDSKPEPQVRS